MKTLKMTIGILAVSLLFSSCNKNEYAPNIIVQDFSVDENSPAGTIIGTVVAYDKDDGQVVSFEIIDGNSAGICEIDPLSGTISVKDATNLDYETFTQLVLTITVSDNHAESLSTTAEITIQIINVLEVKQLTLNLHPDGEEGKDALFGSIVPNTNYGDIEDIHLYAWTNSGTPTANRVVMDFNLTTIPEGATIDRAYLSLYFNNTSAYRDQHEGDTDFIIRRITSAWDESFVTWSTQPTSSDVRQVFVDGAILPDQSFPDIDVTALIQDYVDDRLNSFGMLLRFQYEEPYRILMIASSDHPNETIRPRLEVSYTITE